PEELLNLPIEELRKLAQKHRLIVLRGFAPLSEDNLIEFCSSWGALLKWNFGMVLNLFVHDVPKNYLFTNGDVPLHWDGAFAEAVPSYQFFQCLTAPLKNSGGETLFCDTVRVWEDATATQRARWRSVQITYTTDKVAHYGGQVSANLVSEHPQTGQETLRFAEPTNQDTESLNPLTLEVKGVPPEEVNQLLRDLLKTLYAPEHCYAHQWIDGDFLIADNHALLHGRRPFLAHSPRHLQRVHIL
ncbi:MAG: TauD/TfdA family dioxygenase, partial [Pyrinomonadaceae bacterium]